VGLFDGLKKMFGGGGARKGPPGAPKRKKVRLAKTDTTKRFDLRGRTGQGSMSKVFQAYDRNLGRTVCLKLLDKEKTAKFEARFLGLYKPSEGEICMGFKHPNIVTFYEHGLSQKGEPFLVMEWIDGQGLNFLIETKSSQLIGHRIDYLCQMCEALDYLHRQRFLHRDICPRNAMVTKEGQLKLIDFGLTVPYTPEFCRPGNRTGTADYLAPEIIKRQTTDHRVDLFALGVTAFEIFTGGLPWERAATSEETLRRHMNRPARDPRELKPDLDEKVARILLKSIDRDPAARFTSAAAFRDALKALGKEF
jgi:eukaryotic-like serine/threonine-protein kinase